MKSIVRGVAVTTILGLATFMNARAIGQEIVTQRLMIDKISSVRELEAEMVEIVVVQSDGTKTALRMNLFTARNLANSLRRFIL